MQVRHTSVSHSPHEFSLLQSCRFPQGNLLQICTHWTLHSLFCFILARLGFGSVQSAPQSCPAIARFPIPSKAVVCIVHYMPFYVCSCGVCIAESCSFSRCATPIKNSNHPNLCLIGNAIDMESAKARPTHTYLYKLSVCLSPFWSFVDSLFHKFPFFPFELPIGRPIHWPVERFFLQIRTDQRVKSKARAKGSPPDSRLLFRQLRVRLIICHRSNNNNNFSQLSENRK